jgi:DNA adenine methylase
MQQCPHQWLITYDDSPTIRENFFNANLFEWELQYGMNNYKQNTAAKGKELFISNYEVERLQTSHRQEVSVAATQPINQLSLDLLS